jgi:hypothetical protein
MTPKTLRTPAPAPSTASDRAKQLASLASLTGPPRCTSRSCWKGLPLSHVELAFCTSRLAGATEPGMPMPMLLPLLLGLPALSSSTRTMVPMARTVAP